MHNVLCISGNMNTNGIPVMYNIYMSNPFKPEFTIVIFIQNKPRIAVAIPDL